MSKKILVAAHGDDDPTRDAVALGIHLARLLDGDLVLAGLWASPLGPGDGLYDHTVRAEIKHELTRLRASVPDDVFTTTTILGATSIPRGLHKLAGKVQADVLVLGPSRLGHAARTFRGDVALSVAQDAPCAVVVAPHGYRDRTPQADVALAWDGSPEAAHALEAAVDLAARTGGTLRPVFVLEAPYRHADRDERDPAEEARWMTTVLEAGQRTLADAEAAVAGRVPVVGEVRSGIAAEELLDAAASAAVLVVGSRGYGPVRRLLLGSTTAALLEHATVPILAVPRGAETPAAPASVAATTTGGT